LCIIKKAVYENGIVLLSVLVENESYLQDMETLFNQKLNITILVSRMQLGLTASDFFLISQGLTQPMIPTSINNIPLSAGTGAECKLSYLFQ